MRRRTNSRTGSTFSPENLAGWIFADILIVLFIVGLGSAIPPVPLKPVPTPVPTHTPKPAPNIVGMKTSPDVIMVRYDSDKILESGAGHDSERRTVCNQLRLKTSGVRKQRAAVVLIFGGGGNINRAVRAAAAVGKQLNCTGSPFSKTTVRRTFWDGSLPSGAARVEVFMFVKKG